MGETKAQHNSHSDGIEMVRYEGSKCSQTGDYLNQQKCRQLVNRRGTVQERHHQGEVKKEIKCTLLRQVPLSSANRSSCGGGLLLGFRF
jgi:hypothetical protein